MGVQRQYTGTAGRIENAQVASYLAYAAPGAYLVDRQLYLPKDWCEGPQRGEAAGVPDEVELATKPALATQMITTALDAGVPARGQLAMSSTAPIRAAPEAAATGYRLRAGHRPPTAR